ncbi:MAG: hypothetical protein HC905_16150 [Bacteroidales bacterium]|nr:hypothetical protein [Bacteroidales bacterium]
MWSKLANKFEAIKQGENQNLRILHLGDSHIQGDYFTGQVRNNLNRYLNVDNPSRGLIFPYYVAGTNGPDEIFTSSRGCFGHNSIRKNLTVYYSITGYQLFGCDTFCSITLSDTSKYRFGHVKVFHSPAKGTSVYVNNVVSHSTIAISDSMEVSEFILKETSSELKLELRSISYPGNFKIYGLYLDSNHGKITYNSAGINGATFGTFLQLQGVRDFLKFLQPDCVIFSYGTNDVLGRNLDTIRMKEQIFQCIRLVRETLPDIPVVLTTPGDHLTGRKYVNPRIKSGGRIIKQVAAGNNCAWWDFYEVMGGEGSAGEWYKSQLMFRDMIHLSKKGYRVQGDLFTSALIDLFEEINYKSL